MKIRAIAAAVGLAALVITPAAAARGATQAKPAVWNYEWKPGTPLPKIGAGEKLVAWPVQSVMGKIQVGHTVPMVMIGQTTSTGKFVQMATSAAVRGVTNYGVVNLLAEPDSCDVPQLQENLGKRWTTVGTSFSTVSYATQHFVYTQDQSSSLEVGLSSTAPSGPYTIDGSVSVSDGSDGGETYPHYHKGNERYYTYFRYGRYVQICGSRFSFETYYYIKAFQWTAGAAILHPLHVPSFHNYNCVPQPANTGFTKKSTSAITFSVGFSVPGFSGTSHTGYDVSTEVSMGFSRNGALCGQYDVPPGNSRTLIATTPNHA